MQSSIQNNGCNGTASPPLAHLDENGGDKKTPVISVEAAAAAVEALVRTDQLEETQEDQQQPGSARAMPAKAPKSSRRKDGVHPLVGADQGAELQENSAATEADVTNDIPVEHPIDNNQNDFEKKDAESNLNKPTVAVLNLKDEKPKDDQTCRSGWTTCPTVNELGIHFKKQRVINQVCHRCGITKFETYSEFEEHLLVHLKEVTPKVKLEVLDQASLPPPPPPCRSVARKRTHKIVAHPVREPIKLTLRLTTGRKAKAAEERHEAERRAEMLTAVEASANTSLSKPEPSTKEEALFQKAMTELNSPVTCDSPAHNFELRFSPSPPASTASDPQSSSSRPSSRPSSVGGGISGTISVRPPEALQAHPGSTDAGSLLMNMINKIGSPPPQITHEPEFVSLDRLANPTNVPTVAKVTLLDTSSQFLNTTAPSYQPMHLQNMAAMTPNPLLLTNLLMQSPSPLNMNSHLPSQVPMNTNFNSPNSTVPTSASSPQGMVFPCNMCGTRWPNSTALEAHCSVAHPFRCAMCNHKFTDQNSLNLHTQAAHGQPSNIPYLQQQPRNPPPLYRATVMTTQQQYQPNPPPLVYQQAQIRGVSQIRQYSPRPDQFRAVLQRQPAPSTMRQSAPAYQPRHIAPAPQPRIAGPMSQTQITPTKRPAPQMNTASPPVKKRPEIPARQPEDCQIIAVQQSGEGVPQIHSVQGSATTIPGTEKSNSSIKVTSEITMSVAPKQDQQKKNNVASLLAIRGITVTPSKSKNNEAAKTTTPPPSIPPVIPESLAMNSSISILPASRSNTQSSSQPQQPSSNNFAVPRARPSPVNNNSPAASVERPPRPPTVDLTADAANQASRSPTSPNGVRRPLACSVCQRPMPSPDALQQHMQVHHPQQAAAAQQRATQNKLPYRCSLCPATYPTIQSLQTHRQSVHKEPAPPPPSPGDMGIPVVDLRTPGTVDRLTRIGIHHYIPLPAQNGAGYFAVPLLSADVARNPSAYSLNALNANCVMPFGPLRAFPR